MQTVKTDEYQPVTNRHNKKQKTNHHLNGSSVSSAPPMHQLIAQTTHNNNGTNSSLVHMSSSSISDHQNNSRHVINASSSSRYEEELDEDDDDDDDDDDEEIDDDNNNESQTGKKGSRKKAHGTSKGRDSKKTKGRVKIKMEFIENKIRRYTTFSKRKTGIMKKAHELSILTGTQVMLLVASETGHVYTFATKKLQPMITSDTGKNLIQQCLNSTDEQSKDDSNHSQFEETEFNYNVMPSGEDALLRETHENSNQSQGNQQDAFSVSMNQANSGFLNMIASHQQSTSPKNAAAGLTSFGKQMQLPIVSNSTPKARNGNSGATTNEISANNLIFGENGLILNIANQAYNDNKYSNFQI